MRNLLLCGALLAGCGSDASSPTGQPASGIALDRFEEEFLAAQCDRLFECCDARELSAVFKMAPSTTRAQCEAYLARDSEFGSIEARVAAGKALYDGKAAETCIAKYRATACTMMRYSIDDGACRATFKGINANGAACADSRDCTSNFCAGTNGGAMPGTCAAEPALGEACPEGRCAPGATCDLNTAFCVAPKADGATCITGSECASGYCDFAGTKLCAPAPASERCWPL